MSEPDFIRVASVDDVAQGKSLCVEVDGREILLCRTAEGLYAVDNLCTHGAARLCEGKLKGQRILCPLHGAAFDVRSGEALSRPAVRPLASHAVTLNGDDILITLQD